MPPDELFGSALSAFPKLEKRASMGLSAVLKVAAAITILASDTPSMYWPIVRSADTSQLNQTPLTLIA